MMDEIIGKKVIGLQLGGIAGIAFRLEGGDYFAYEPTIYCCESKEITHISGVQYLIGHTIQSIESRGYTQGKQGFFCDDCVIDNAFFQIKTDKGMFDFEGRNMHAGEYGGFVFEPVKEWHSHEWIDITEDF